MKQLHTDIKVRHASNGSFSDAITVDNSVKWTFLHQHFSLSTILLSHTFEDSEAGVALRFRAPGRVLIFRRFNTKNSECLIRGLLHADDAEFVAHT